MSQIRCSKSDQIKHWLNSIESDEYDHAESICSNVMDSGSTIIESSSETESGEEFALGNTTSNPLRNSYSNDLLKIPAITFNNVSITNSTNVHLGTICKVNGNLNINLINNEERHQNVVDVQMRSTQPNKSQNVRPACFIFPRIRWLAMDPLDECHRLQEPVEYIVICQSTTASSTEQAKNVGIIRDLQTLNVESQGFNDIIYNFLIGCDGIVYEGRGWGVHGDHMSTYKNNSISVAFVGNFKRNLPSERALKVCRKLFNRGVAEGHLSKDYKIVLQYEFLNKDSDNVLHKEVTNWDHYYDVCKGNKELSDI